MTRQSGAVHCPPMTTADHALDIAAAAHSAARRKLLWWLAGFGYAAFCIGGRYLPRDLIGDGFVIFLNGHGAAITGLVCAVGAATAFSELRRERGQLNEVAQAWAAEQPPRAPRRNPLKSSG